MCLGKFIKRRISVCPGLNYKLELLLTIYISWMSMKNRNHQRRHVNWTASCRLCMFMCKFNLLVSVRLFASYRIKAKAKTCQGQQLMTVVFPSCKVNALMYYPSSLHGFISIIVWVSVDLVRTFYNRTQTVTDGFFISADQDMRMQQ